MIKKNRVRSPYTFANINLLGKCNVNCFFCIGKDIEEELKGKSHINQCFSQWPQLAEFLTLCVKLNIKKLFLTSPNTDALLYKHFGNFRLFLQQDGGFEFGIRTNGYNYYKWERQIKKLNGEIGYSIQTLDPQLSKKILGREDIPDWDYILRNSGENVRVSIVVNRYNIEEMESLIEFVSRFPKVRYIQIRRISTDTRYEFHKPDIEIFEQYYKEFNNRQGPSGYYEKAPIYRVNGKQVVFWRVEAITANSLNYFTDGTISMEYFVVEGYLKNRSK